MQRNVSQTTSRPHINQTPNLVSHGRRRGRGPDPDQFDLFEPPHERCEDGRGAYLQFLIAPPTELAGTAIAARPELGDIGGDAGPTPE